MTGLRYRLLDIDFHQPARLMDIPDAPDALYVCYATGRDRLSIRTQGHYSGKNAQLDLFFDSSIRLVAATETDSVHTELTSGGHVWRYMQFYNNNQPTGYHGSDIDEPEVLAEYLITLRCHAEHALKTAITPRRLPCTGRAARFSTMGLAGVVELT